jgi:hypothetical protein
VKYIRNLKLIIQLNNYTQKDMESACGQNERRQVAEEGMELYMGKE